jgi:coenzyme PQQ precursor peptide PqqA
VKQKTVMARTSSVGQLHRFEPKGRLARCFPTGGRARLKEKTMAWTTPTLVEICIGLEINGYLPAEF